MRSDRSPSVAPGGCGSPRTRSRSKPRSTSRSPGIPSRASSCRERRQRPYRRRGVLRGQGVGCRRKSGTRLPGAVCDERRPAAGIIAAGAIGQIDDEGAFVAERPGLHTIVAIAGSHTAVKTIEVRPRNVRMGVEVVDKDRCGTAIHRIFGCGKHRMVATTPSREPGVRMATLTFGTSPNRRVFTSSIPAHRRPHGEPTSNARNPSHRRQPLSSQDEKSPRFLGKSPACSYPLHTDLFILAQSRRTMVLQDRARRHR